MTKQHLVVGSLLLIALLLIVNLVHEASYLQRGYTMTISMSGGAGSVYPVTFPPWRRTANLVLGASLVLSIGLTIFRPQVAWPVAWGVLAAVFAIRAYDFEQYGVSSPTSLSTVGLVLLAAAAASFLARKVPEAKEPDRA